MYQIRSSPYNRTSPRHDGGPAPGATSYSLSQGDDMAGPIIRGRVVLALGLATLAGAAPAAGDAVDDIIRADMAARKIPGLSLAIVERGEMVKAAGYGLASVELGGAGDPGDDLSGRLHHQAVHGDAGDVPRRGGQGRPQGPGPQIPGPRGTRVGAGDGVSPAHAHGRGLRVGRQVNRHERDYTEDELVAKILGLPLEFEPGTRWAYSNPGYVLLGALTRRVTGRPYGEELRRASSRRWG